MRVIAIFDFDKTLISADSFRLFSYISAEKFWGKSFVFMFAILCKIKLMSNQKYKELILRMFWQKKSLNQKAVILQKLYSKLQKFENEKIIKSLANHLKRCHKVIVLSASPIFYLKPYIRRWSDKIEVYGTEVNIQNSKIRVKNLRGQEKLRCAKSLINNETPNHIWVYTDHISDLPIIMLANHVCLVNPSLKLKNRLAKLQISHEVVV